MRRRLPPERMYPAGEQGISVSRLQVGDVALRVISSGPPDGHAMVLVHGWGACVYSFSELIPALARERYRAIAIDLPGHGLSDKPTDERRYTTRALADSVLGALDALGIQRFAIAGHSMGGSIALDIACRETARLTGLILFNAVGLGRVPVLAPLRLVSPKFVDHFAPRLLTRPLVRLILALTFAKRGRPTDRDVDEYWAPSQFREYAWACRACAHHVSWGPVAEGALRALEVPVLVVTGGRDRMVHGADRRARLIPHAHMSHVEDGGHLALQECADRVGGDVVRFLREHVPS